MRRCVPGVVLTLAMLFPVLAHADGIIYQFNAPFPNDGYPDGGSGSAPWIDATFQNTSGGVLLTVDNVGMTANEFLKGNSMPNGSDGGIFFNLNPSLDSSHLTFTLESGANNFGTTFFTGNNAFKADGVGGKYDIVFDFSNGFYGGASVTYFISGISGLDAADFAYQSVPTAGNNQFYAAAHIQGLSNGSSTWVDPSSGPIPLMPIPEPSVLALGAASLGLGIAWRRARKV